MDIINNELAMDCILGGTLLLIGLFCWFLIYLGRKLGRVFEVRAGYFEEKRKRIERNQSDRSDSNYEMGTWDSWENHY